MANEKFDVPSLEQMLEKGVHFGHQTKRWNPLMKDFIYSADRRTHIIDIYQTREALQKACEFLYEVAKQGKQIVLVGSKRQASDTIEVHAKDAGALFVNQRWLGGTFTNFDSIKHNWERLNTLRQQKAAGELKKYTKKERLLIDREIEKLELIVGGINGMKKYPGAMLIIDVKREATAVKEANAVGVPVVGIVDTNSDPSNINVVIPANDDAIKSLDLMLGSLCSAIKAGYKDYAQVVSSTANKTESKPQSNPKTDKKPFFTEAQSPKVKQNAKVAKKDKEQVSKKDTKAKK